MPDQPFESGDDDWVKQMLAEAMLEPGTPLSAPDAATTPEVETTPDVVELAGPAEATDTSTEATPEPIAEPIGTVEESEPAAGAAAELVVAADPISGAGGTIEDAPDGVSSSPILERPSFDATNDPGVDSMIRSEVSETTVSDDDERSSVRGVVEWIVVLGSAVVVALLLRAFLFQAFYIPSESMEETLLVEDRVMVNKLSYRLHDIYRGDVVVFSRLESEAGEFRELIKRVIGLPGETIEARDNTIYINGQVLIEPYLTPGEVIGDFDPVDIPDGELFVMGDNRDNSGDSRVFGTIETGQVIGRAFFLFWPLDRLGSL